MRTIPLLEIKAFFVKGKPDKIKNLKHLFSEEFPENPVRKDYYTENILVGRTRKTLCMGKEDFYPISSDLCIKIIDREEFQDLDFCIKDASGLIKTISKKDLKQCLSADNS